MRQANIVLTAAQVRVCSERDETPCSARRLIEAIPHNLQTRQPRLDAIAVFQRRRVAQHVTVRSMPNTALCTVHALHASSI